MCYILQVDTVQPHKKREVKMNEKIESETYLISEKEKAIITAMCDLTLKAQGLKNISEVNSVLNVLANPITPKKVVKKGSTEKNG